MSANTAGPRRALVSVSDKTGLGSFIEGLVALGFEILSTGGTSRFLKERGIDVIDVSTYTGFPEIMDGRVKTLHPKIHGAILGRPDLDSDALAIQQHGIIPFELVVVNLYPFEETIAKPGIAIAEAIEQIDIGGPSMVRSAAKNHSYIGIVTAPSQYEEVLAALQQGPLSHALKRQLAGAAFESTARYDRAISDYFATLEDNDRALAAGEPSPPAFPPRITLTLDRRASLRYGENPHQKAAFFVEPGALPSALSNAECFHGKELSYNNLLDLDAALTIVREFQEPAAVVIKHNNPCGCAIASTLADAFDRAHAGDPISAFGSIIGFNRSVDLATAERLCEPGRFIEAIIAPDYAQDAVALLTTKPKWKNNVRLLRLPQRTGVAHSSLDYRRVSGGLLVQERDDLIDPQDEWHVVTKRQPTSEERRTLEFAWKVCKHVKSNAILLAQDGMVVGVGAGQMSRLDSSFIAAHKAADRARGSVVASDAFFPFRDGIDEAAKGGVTAAIQPGGSKGDAEVIAAANEHNIAMIFTARRHFKH